MNENITRTRRQLLQTICSVAVEMSLSIQAVGAYATDNEADLVYSKAEEGVRALGIPTTYEEIVLICNDLGFVTEEQYRRLVQP